ncbi:MAG: hypothetical protein IR164_18035 [Devosia sp.]|uniref:hypothetical protein n=1 Tax=Devosia sp. TaxID=1871048 RepID=UPI0019E8071A|nr:hypothetical protein [Devosia sp.]MBF0680829.1 hypothetical protein [Devosia sp.]
MTVIPPLKPPHGFQTLRQAFDRFGYERFSEWTDTTVDSPDAPLWGQAVDAFVQELEAGRIKMFDLLANGKFTETSSDCWRKWNADQRLATYLLGHDGEADTQFYGEDCPHYVPMPVAEPDTLQMAQQKKHRGRGPLLDVEQYQPAFKDECERRGGRPDRKHPDEDWRSQRDVADWLCKLARREGVILDKDDTTAKKYARLLMGSNS